MKSCTKCKKEYPATVEFFSPDRAVACGLDSQCRPCQRQKAREWRLAHIEQHKEANRRWSLANAERVKENQKRWRDTHREHKRAKSRQWLYGLTVEEHARLLEKQGGLCAICRKPSPKVLYVDHDHTNGRVRGLLCSGCNRGLGGFADDPEVLSRAVTYLLIN